MIKIDQWLIRVRGQGRSKIVKCTVQEIGRKLDYDSNDEPIGLWDNITPPSHYLDNLGLDDAIANRI